MTRSIVVLSLTSGQRSLSFLLHPTLMSMINCLKARCARMLEQSLEGLSECWQQRHFASFRSLSSQPIASVLLSDRLLCIFVVA